MKTTLLVLGLALGYSIALSQEFEIALQPAFFSEAKFIQRLDDDRWIVAGDQRAHYPNPSNVNPVMYLPLVMVVNHQGEIIWTYHFEDLGHPGRVTGIKPTTDGTFLVYGYLAACDYVSDGFIYEFDKDGTILFQYSEDDFNSPTLPNIYYLDEFPNGDFLISNYSGLYRYDREINHVNSARFLRRTHSEVMTLTDSVFFALYTTEDGSLNYTDFISFDTILFLGGWDNVIAPPERPLLQSQVVENKFVFLTQDRLSFLEPYPFSLKEYNISAYGDFSRFDWQDDRLVFLGKNTSDQTIILYTDTTFNNPSIIPVDVPNFISADIAIQGKKIAVTGKHVSYPEHAQNLSPVNLHQYGSSAFFIKQYDLNNPVALNNHDLGVTDISWTSDPEIDQHYCSDAEWEGHCPVTYNYTFNDIEVKVKNFGTTAIQSLNINIRKELCESCKSICYQLHDQSRSYTGLDLAPGETQTFYFGDLRLEAQLYNSPLELCFWTSVPNDEIDRTPENDVFCTEVPWEFGPETFEENNFTIYPNPTTEQLNIDFNSLPDSPISYRIFDYLGHELSKGALPGFQTNHSLDVASWPSGVYLLEVFQNEQLIKKPFVVNR